ncbi:MAG TPA: glycosyltransferase [Alphaproteobacteria bacterium]|nr:glycosyltransferase [Alphaproteobacteria bacterium]
MRVLFLTKNLLPGGTERQLALVASGLSRRGMTVAIVCVQSEAGEAEKLLSDEVERFYLRCGSWRDPRALPRLLRVLRRLRPAVVYSFLGEQNILAAAAKLFGPRFRLVASRRSTDWGVGRPQHALERAAGWLADVIVAPSQGVMEFHSRQERISKRKCFVIPNGVVIPSPTTAAERAAARRSFGLPEDALVVGTLGRHIGEKALDVLIKASAELPAGAVVAIAGGGELLAGHRALVAKLGLEKKVFLLGHVGNPDDFLRALDVFVLPSISEGSPNALLEAMAFGLPVVATSIPGVLDLLPGEGWSLVPPSDSDALAGALRELISSPDKRAELGARARRRAEKFSIDRVVQMHEELYRSLWEERR